MFYPSTGKKRSREDLKEIFDIEVDFLCYERLVRKLSRIRITNVANELNSPNIPYKLQTVMNGKQFTKLAYDAYLKSLIPKNKESNQRIKSKWESDVGEHASGTLVNLMNATKSTYLYYFHYKIVTRIYPTNNLLSKMKIAQSSACSFCQNETETIAHLFWYCPKVQTFIEEMVRHIKQNYQKTPKFSKKAAL